MYGRCGTCEHMDDSIVSGCGYLRWCYYYGRWVDPGRFAYDCNFYKDK